MDEEQLLRRYGFKPAKYHGDPSWFIRDGSMYSKGVALSIIRSETDVPMVIQSYTDPKTMRRVAFTLQERDTRIHDPLIDLGGEG